MKKIIATLLAVMMIAAMSTTAFAAEGSETLTESKNTQTIDVTAKYEDGVQTVNVVSADVSWGAMEFTYSVSGTKTWNPTDHKYDTVTTPSWGAKGNTVTVANHSDVKINVEFTYASEADYADIKGKFDNTSATLDAHPKAADPNSTEAADSVTTTLTLEGELASDVTTAQKVGTITVKISK